MKKPVGMYYPLPDQTTVTKTRCMQIEIPDDDQYESLLRGALLDLTKWWKYERDEAHLGKVVAKNWWVAFDSLAACPLPDNRNGWDEDLTSLCESLRFQNGKLQALCCGDWVDITGQPPQGIGGTGQPGTGQPIAPPGQCANYHAGINGNSAWTAPFIVNAGDTLTFSNATGAWSDGAGGPVSAWWLPSGNQYFAGLDVGSPIHEGGDPSSSLYHMQLCAVINGVYYRADGGTVTVPGGVSNAPVTLVANDATIADNFGTVSVDIAYCNNAMVEGTWMTVDHGSLPSQQIHVGDNIVIDSVFSSGTGTYQVEIEFDLTSNHATSSAAQYTFLLTGAYTPPGSGVPWAYQLEGASEVFGAPGASWPGLPSGSWVDLLAFNSTVPFTLSFVISGLRNPG